MRVSPTLTLSLLAVVRWSNSTRLQYSCRETTALLEGCSAVLKCSEGEVAKHGKPEGWS